MRRSPETQSALPIDLQTGQLVERICVVIPMYKVEPYIVDVLRGIPDWVDLIVLVDDASPDGSAEQASRVGDPRVALVRHTQNQGVGGAMLAGYRRAVELGATIMIKMDGDNQMDPAYLPDLVRPILEGRADYTKGNRFADAHLLAGMPFIRRIGNLGLSFLLKLASGYWKIFDPTNGYTAIDALVFQRINHRYIHRRYFFESSMLVELNLNDAVIEDVRMPALYRGEASSLSVSRTLVEFPLLIIKGFFRRFVLRYFVLDFSPGSLFFILGVLMVLFGAAWGGVKWLQSISMGVPATTGTVMIAVLPFILGFQLLLQAVNYDLTNSPTTPVSRNAPVRAIKSKIIGL